MDISNYQQIFNTFIKNVDMYLEKENNTIDSMNIYYTKKNNTHKWICMDNKNVTSYKTIDGITDIHSLQFECNYNTFTLPISFNETFDIDTFKWIIYALENIYHYYRDVSIETNIQKKYISHIIDYIAHFIIINEDVCYSISPSISVYNLPNFTTYSDIKSMFSQFGEIIQIILHQGDSSTTESKHAIISYIDSSSAEICAKTMDKHMYYGHVLDVIFD